MTLSLPSRLVSTATIDAGFSDNLLSYSKIDSYE